MSPNTPDPTTTSPTQPTAATAMDLDAAPTKTADSLLDAANDLEDQDDEGPDPALAAAMGFTTFGAPKHHKNPLPTSSSKKRKLDDGSDAASSGANATPLGPGPGPRLTANEPKSTPASGNVAFEQSKSNTMTATTELPPRPRKIFHLYEVEAGNRDSGVDLAAYRKGVRDGRGDVAYFLPSFVEDPWARMR